MFDLEDYDVEELFEEYLEKHEEDILKRILTRIAGEIGYKASKIKSYKIVDGQIIFTGYLSDNATLREILKTLSDNMDNEEKYITYEEYLPEVYEDILGEILVKILNKHVYNPRHMSVEEMEEIYVEFSNRLCKKYEFPEKVLNSEYDDLIKVYVN